MHGVMNKAALRLIRSPPTALTFLNARSALLTASRFRGSISKTGFQESIVGSVRSSASDRLNRKYAVARNFLKVTDSKTINRTKKGKSVPKHESSRSSVSKKSNGKTVYMFRRFSSKKNLGSSGDGNKNKEPPQNVAPTQAPSKLEIVSPSPNLPDRTAIEQTKENQSSETALNLDGISSGKIVKSHSHTEGSDVRKRGVKICKVKKERNVAPNNFPKHRSRPSLINERASQANVSQNDDSQAVPKQTQTPVVPLRSSGIKGIPINVNTASKPRGRRVSRNVAIVELNSAPLKFSSTEMVFPGVGGIISESKGRIGRARMDAAAETQLTAFPGEKSAIVAEKPKKTVDQYATKRSDFTSEATDEVVKKPGKKLTKSSHLRTPKPLLEPAKKELLKSNMKNATSIAKVPTNSSEEPPVEKCRPAESGKAKEINDGQTKVRSQSSAQSASGYLARCKITSGPPPRNPALKPRSHELKRWKTKGDEANQMSGLDRMQADKAERIPSQKKIERREGIETRGIADSSIQEGSKKENIQDAPKDPNVIIHKIPVNRTKREGSIPREVRQQTRHHKMYRAEIIGQPAKPTEQQSNIKKDVSVVKTFPVPEKREIIFKPVEEKIFDVRNLDVSANEDEFKFTDTSNISGRKVYDDPHGASTLKPDSEINSGPFLTHTSTNGAYSSKQPSLGSGTIPSAALPSNQGCAVCPTCKPPFPPLCKTSCLATPAACTPPAQCCPPSDPPCSLCKPPFPPISKSSNITQCPPEPSSCCCPPVESNSQRCPTCKPPFPPICKQSAPRFAPCPPVQQTCPNRTACVPPSCQTYGSQPATRTCPTCKPRFQRLSKARCRIRRPKPQIRCKPSTHSYPRTPEPCPPAGYKSKSHSVHDTQEMPQSPTPICIDCVPKCRPRFPPACAERFGCDKIREGSQKSPKLKQLWQKSDGLNSDWLRNASFSMSDMYSSARDSLKSAICNALSLLQNKVCKDCPRTKHAHYGQAQFNAPTFWTRKTSQIVGGKRPYVKSSIPPILKPSLKKKVRYVKSVKRGVLDGNSRKAILAEQQRRKSSGIAPPTLAYSDVLNIVFSQKCSNSVCR